MPEFAADDGVRLHYDDAGTGAPVLFIHGWMMSGRFFEHQVRALRGLRRCVTLDLRGCGRSQARPGTHTMDRFADDVAGILRHLELDGAVLAGWSMGGGITMRFLDRHGGARLAGVCLIDFPPRFEEDPAVPDRVCGRLATDRDAFMEGFYRRMFMSPPPAPDLEWMRAETGRCLTQTGCEMYRQLGVGDATGRVYDVPALLCFPEHGWFPKALDAWRTIFPRHRAPAFPKSRHCPFLEEAEAFNEALRRFPAGL